MPLQGFDHTLTRFGLDKLKIGLDLQITDGTIAVTRDGDFQLGNTRDNALFRLVERWRHSESAITELFAPMALAMTTLRRLSNARALDEGPKLSEDPQAYHEVTDCIIEADLVSSTLAGSIAVILNSLFQRLRLDINASQDEWHQAAPPFRGFSVGEIFAAAAANFRHHDEWASTKAPSAQQLVSMKVLCGLLKVPIETERGLPTIRTNVCGRVLLLLCHGSIDVLHQLTFSYAKALTKYE